MEYDLQIKATDTLRTRPKTEKFEPQPASMSTADAWPGQRRTLPRRDPPWPARQRGGGEFSSAVPQDPLIETDRGPVPAWMPADDWIAETRG